MVTSTYPTPINFGFLSLCEGALVGSAAGWWLRTHHQPPLVFIGCGLVVAGLYYWLLCSGRGSSACGATIVLSVIIWAAIGWNVGAYAFKMFDAARSGATLLDTLAAWKLLAAMIFGFIAYTEKAALAGHDST